MQRQPRMTNHQNRPKFLNLSRFLELLGVDVTSEDTKQYYADHHPSTPLGPSTAFTSYMKGLAIATRMDTEDVNLDEEKHGFCKHLYKHIQDLNERRHALHTVEADTISQRILMALAHKYNVNIIIYGDAGTPRLVYGSRYVDMNDQFVIFKDRERNLELVSDNDMPFLNCNNHMITQLLSNITYWGETSKPHIIPKGKYSKEFELELDEITHPEEAVELTAYYTLDRIWW